MDFTDPAFIGIAVAIFFVILFLANAIRIVPEYQRLVVFRLGRLLGREGTGPDPADPDRGQRGEGRSP